MPASGLPLRVPARLQAELARCLGCETKPCREACPVRCSPADFIAAAKGGEPWDLRRAAALILDQNPLGGLCGALCPDRFCVAACARLCSSKAATCMGRVRSNALPCVRARNSTHCLPSAWAISAPLPMSNCTAPRCGWLFCMRPVRPSQSS